MRRIICNIGAAIAFIFWLSIPAFSQSSDLQSLRTRAYNGDAQAMIELAQYYKANGKHDLAQSWLEKAEKINPGLIDATKEDFAIEDELNHADIIREKEPMQALNIYLKYYDSNNVHALVSIGYLYDRGIGVSQDSNDANKYYRQAMAIDHERACNYMNVDAPIAFKLLEEEAYNSNNLNIIKKVAAKYFENGHENAYVSTESNPRPHWEKRWDYELLEKAEELYNKAIELGDNEAEKRISEIHEWIGVAKRENEAMSASRERINSTMRNFAGVWTCSNSYTQYKFDSNGNGWFRNGSGRAWETLGVTYKSYNCISVYDAHARHTLEVSGSTMTQDNTYVYRRR